MSTPLFVRFAGARVVGVGAGPVAAAKLLPLLEAGAEVIVVAPEAGREIVAAAAAERLVWHRRGWRPSDLDGALLVVAATADPLVNEAVAKESAARATLCVRVDREGSGSADFAGGVSRGDLTLAVSTGGRAPALTRHVRAELEEAYGPEWGEAVALYGELRDDPCISAELEGLSSDERRRRWRAIPVADILRLLRSGRLLDAKRAAAACLSSSSD